LLVVPKYVLGLSNHSSDAKQKESGQSENFREENIDERDNKKQTDLKAPKKTLVDVAEKHQVTDALKELLVPIKT